MKPHFSKEDTNTPVHRWLKYLKEMITLYDFKDNSLQQLFLDWETSWNNKQSESATPTAPSLRSMKQTMSKVSIFTIIIFSMWLKWYTEMMC